VTAATPTEVHTVDLDRSAPLAQQLYVMVAGLDALGAPHVDVVGALVLSLVGYTCNDGSTPESVVDLVRKAQVVLAGDGAAELAVQQAIAATPATALKREAALVAALSSVTQAAEALFNQMFAVEQHRVRLLPETIRSGNALSLSLSRNRNTLAGSSSVLDGYVAERTAALQQELVALQEQNAYLRRELEQAKGAVLRVGRDPKWAAIYAWLDDHKDVAVKALSDLNGRLEVERDAARAKVEQLRADKAAPAPTTDAYEPRASVDLLRATIRSEVATIVERSLATELLDARAEIEGLRAEARRVRNAADTVAKAYRCQGGEVRVSWFFREAMRRLDAALDGAKEADPNRGPCPKCRCTDIDLTQPCPCCSEPDVADLMLAPPPAARPGGADDA
jgi:hypothetical protein